MAKAGQAKTKMVNGERVDINTGLPYVSQPISSVSLTASQPINVPPAPIPVAAAGLQGNLETQANQFDTNYTKQLEDEKKKQEENKTKSLDNLLTEFGDAKTETQLQDEAYKKNNVDQLNLELKDINDQMLRETEGLRKQVESIQTSAGTATSTERNRAVQEATRVSLRKQADLSIIQLARQGKYDSAKEVADRAVTMELEQERQKLDTYKFIYQEHKDLFTTAEARLFETVQADRERALNQRESDKKAISDLAIDFLKKGGDARTARQIMQSGSLDAALGLSGGVFGDGSGGGLGSSGFKDLETEQSVRQDVVAVLADVDSEVTTLDKAYKKLRTLYSPSEVSDDALKALMGINTEAGAVDKTSALEDEIATMKAVGINNADIRNRLRKRYGNTAIDNSSVGSFTEQLSSFLFGTPR